MKLRFKYVTATKMGFVSFVFFTLVLIFTPQVAEIENDALILTVATFLFAIFGGFYMTRLNSRYDLITELIAEEDAHWLNVYKLSQLFGKQFAKKAANIIDQYYIVAYDFDFSDNVSYYKYNANYLFAFYDLVGSLTAAQRSDSAYESILEELSAIEISRNRVSTVLLERLTTGQWTTMIFLSGIVILDLLLFQPVLVYSQLFNVFLMTSVVMVLFILRDLQKMRLGGNLVLEESGQEVFEYMGKKRYYNNKHLNSGTYSMPKYVNEFRVGFHQPGEKPQIKIMKRGKDF